MLRELLTNKYHRTTSEKQASTLIIDFIVKFRMIANNMPDNFDDLVVRFLNLIPQCYSRVDIVVDCSWDVSIIVVETSIFEVK